MENRYEKKWQTLFSCVPKSQWTVTAAMKLKYTCSLGKKKKKSYDEPRQHIKSRGITFPTKVQLVKVMVFLLVLYTCESWTIMKAECQWIHAFELWCWRRLLRVLGQQDQTSQSSRKSTLNAHWKGWYWSCSSNSLATWCKVLTHWKRPWCW